MWYVMRLCDAQLTDVNPSDILCNGLYRKCDTYKGGGGYDKFSEIYQKRFGKRDNLHNQFVVQLRGCPLDCPYCYVTHEGVHGSNFERITTDQLVEDFRNSNCEVFHLMGGAPAIYLDSWHEIIEKIPDKVFHSDLMLVERRYSPETLRELAKFPNSLYAVSIKGYGIHEWTKNTRTTYPERVMFRNLDTLVDSKLPFYFTFTGMSENTIKNFKIRIIGRYGYSYLEDCFKITIVHYNALDYKKNEGSSI